jgi:hypothetical protein
VTTSINTASSNGDKDFVLEDILRTLTGSALGTSANIDGGQTFATIDSQRNLSFSCKNPRLPNFLGSDSSTIEYSIFEIDS